MAESLESYVWRRLQLSGNVKSTSRSLTRRSQRKRRENLLGSIGMVGINTTASPDAILSLMLRSECDLLHADILNDMRRLEMLNFVKRRKREKAIQESRKRLQDLHVPYASRFHEQPISKTQLQSVNWGVTEQSPSRRQQLLQWAYRHASTWSRSFANCRCSTQLPKTLDVDTDYIQKHEKELCRYFALGSFVDTLAFGLDEYGYSHLSPLALVQDTLLRVQKVRVMEEYKQPLHSRQAFGRISMCHHLFWIDRDVFRVGAFDSETLEHLKQLNPAVEEFVHSRPFTRSVLPNIHGCDMVFVDDSLPTICFEIRYSAESKGWVLVVLRDGIEVVVDTHSCTYTSEPLLLGDCGLIRLNSHEICFEFACS